jgi:hypothetical protein
MANKLYPAFRNTLGTTGLNLTTADLRVLLIDLADYTYADNHEFLSIVSGSAIVSTSPTLTSVTFGTLSGSYGALDAADTSFTNVTGDPSEALILYSHDGGVDSARRLIAYIDTGIVGVPVTPNGGNINLVWSSTGIFNFGT